MSCSFDSPAGSQTGIPSGMLPTSNSPIDLGGPGRTSSLLLVTIMPSLMTVVQASSALGIFFRSWIRHIPLQALWQRQVGVVSEEALR